ncbi:MAG: MATE family efflux transporter, partial [Clostridia bacterium]|nr:MATE family efflux transporter [Clostridia bacterium]
MEVKSIKENKMGVMKITPLLFSVSIPIIISMLVQALYNIVDSIFVAQYDNVAGTGALTIAFPLQNLMIATAVGLAVGTNALLSRSLGQKDFEKANKVAG